MSGPPPTADIRLGGWHVREVPMDETARAVGRRCGRHDQDDSASGASCLEDEGVATSLKTSEPHSRQSVPWSDQATVLLRRRTIEAMKMLISRRTSSKAAPRRQRFQMTKPVQSEM